MSVTLWLDTEKEETIELGLTLPAYEAFAEMAHLAGPVWQRDYADLAGVLTQCELQEDADPAWLADVRAQAADYLKKAGDRISPGSKGILEVLAAGGVKAANPFDLAACGGPGSGVPGPCPEAKPVTPEKAPRPSLVDAAKAKLTEVGKKIYDRLPKPAQKLVDLGQHVEHKAEAFFKDGQELAKEVARGAGYSDRLVEQTGRVLGYADTVSRWGLNWQVAHLALEPVGGPVVAFAGAKASHYFPTASMAFVGFHMGAAAIAGRNPMDVVKGARERIRARAGSGSETKHGWKAVLMAAQAGEDTLKRQFAEAVLKWLDGMAEEKRFWAEALLAAALDETRGDMVKAFKLAREEFDANPDGGK